MRLQGKVALVTGTASGIGYAIAEMFLREGATVFASDIRAPQSVHSAGVEAIKLDVTSESEWATAVAAAGYIAARWAVRELFEGVRMETGDTGVRTTMATFAKVSSEYWENNPGSEARVPYAQTMVPVLSPSQAADAILDGLAAEREEIIAPWHLRMFFLANRLSPSAVRRQMRGNR